MKKRRFVASLMTLAMLVFIWFIIKKSHTDILPEL